MSRKSTTELQYQQYSVIGGSLISVGGLCFLLAVVLFLLSPFVVAVVFGALPVLYGFWFCMFGEQTLSQRNQGKFGTALG
jgi:hypothetical protein